MHMLPLLLCILFILTTCAHDAPSHGMIGQLPLQTEKTTPDSFLATHDTVTEPRTKRFQGDTLAYVTPWNNKGYDIVKQFKGKFDYVSPVWYYVERRGVGQYEIFGEHDVDKSWTEEVGGDGIKIVPRFQFRNWNIYDYQAFVSQSDREAPVVAQAILNQVRRHGFDGIVLECGYPSLFPHFLGILAYELHADNKELVVVLPPLRSPEQNKFLNSQIFATLAQIVDRFSLMTYDYSSHDPAGGPASPVDWIIDNIEWLTDADNRHKLLVGLPMYAMAYPGPSKPPQALLLKDVLERLENSRDKIEIQWDPESEEHWFADLDGTRIWLPTQKFIRQRLHLAEDYGVGLSLWEVGQGLDHFYDIL